MRTGARTWLVVAALVVAAGCARPPRLLTAAQIDLRLLRAAPRPEPRPRPPVTSTTGAGGYDRHPRAAEDGYGYEFSDTWGDSGCAALAACDFERALERAAGAFYECYDLADVPAGRLVGLLTLRLRVSDRGLVSSSEVVASSTGSTDLDACVARAMRAAELGSEEPRSGLDTVVTLPLSLTKGHD